MIQSAVTVSLVQNPRTGPFIFWDDLAAACEKAGALGFDGIEIFAPTAETVDRKVLRQLLDDNDLTLAAVGTGAGWVLQQLQLCAADQSVREKAKAFVRSIIDWGGEFNAPAIIGSMQGRWDQAVPKDDAMGYLKDAAAELSEHAAKYQVPLIIEPLNRYETNMLNTVADGVRLIQDLDTDNVVLLADLFHMNIEEVDIAESLRAGGRRIGHVHFVDSNRRPAGFGHLDYAPVAKALADINYQGFASAETLPWPNPDEAAKQTIKAFFHAFERDLNTED